MREICRIELRAENKSQALELATTAFKVLLKGGDRFTEVNPSKTLFTFTNDQWIKVEDNRVICEVVKSYLDEIGKELGPFVTTVLLCSEEVLKLKPSWRINVSKLYADLLNKLFEKLGDVPKLVSLSEDYIEMDNLILQILREGDVVRIRVFSPNDVVRSVLSELEFEKYIEKAESSTEAGLTQEVGESSSTHEVLIQPM